MRRVILPMVAVALLATPALAQGRARCDADDNRPGLHIEFGVSFGNTKRDRETDEQIWKMHLRQRGVDARTVSRTDDGCLEAYVQNPDGSWNTQYYDEDTFRLVQD
ncbi:MAG: hypothetical protein ACTHLT_00145 [Devosia sp.]